MAIGLTDDVSPCSTPTGRGATWVRMSSPAATPSATQATISRQRSGTCTTCCTVIDSGRFECSTIERISAISSAANSASSLR